jgi:hypothetical protein
MRPNTWFGRFWTRVIAGVVQDVPPSLEKCESCREVDCTQERWLTCARRLAAEGERGGAGDSATPLVTGRTDEMPGIFAAEDPQAAPGDGGSAESGDRRKSISSSSD